MKFLGNISHLSNSGKLIARSSKTPPAGAFVFTNDKQKIGKVYNIFGPVKNPYISINVYRSVNKRDLESRQGEKLFVSTKKEMEKLSKINKKERKSKNSKNPKNSKRTNKSKKSNKSNFRNSNSSKNKSNSKSNSKNRKRNKKNSKR